MLLSSRRARFANLPAAGLQLLALLLLLGVAPRTTLAAVQVNGLRCELRSNPVGVEAAAPRLSWMLQSSTRGCRQSAYQILAASSREALDRDRGDLWNSTKVDSDQSTLVPYAGQKLASAQRVWWKVRVWDQDDAVSAWSKPAFWEMGFLEPEDWQARWIGAEAKTQLTVEGVPWIWHAEGNPASNAPAGTRYFRKRLMLPLTAQAESARLMLTADNEFVVYLNGTRVGNSGSQEHVWQRLFTYDIQPFLVPGHNILAVAAVNQPPSNPQASSPAGLIAKVIATFPGGDMVESQTDATWKSAATAGTGWETAAFDDAAWSPAMALGAYGMAPWGRPTSKPTPLPLFRKTFALDRPVQSARLRICGLGFYEASLNGRRIGDQVLDPGWTDYRKTCLYSTYDVTDLLSQGANALGVMLGNGPFHMPGGRYCPAPYSYGPPQLIAQLDIVHPEGATTRIVSDATWKTAPGPITFSCLYGGEDHDAGKEVADWNKPGLADGSWKQAAIVSSPGGRLTAQSTPPVKVMEVLPARLLASTNAGLKIHDLGQNIAGWPRLRVRGPAGSSVKIIPGELLASSGKVTQGSSGGPVSFQYTLKGQGVETWEPRFSYTGFRYLQIETRNNPDDPGAAQPEILGIDGCLTRSSADRIGSFTCSLDLFNRIHELAVRAIACNLQSVITRSPHRDKSAALEIAHLMSPGLILNFDTPALLQKTMQDLADAQREDGLVPDTAPAPLAGPGPSRDVPEKGAACLMIPWRQLLYYSDTNAHVAWYPMGKRYMEYLTSRATNDLLLYGQGDWFDVGPQKPGPSQRTSPGLTASAMYYYGMRVLTVAGTAAGQRPEVLPFLQRARDVVLPAFNNEFFAPSVSLYDRGSQTAFGVPFCLGMVPKDSRPTVLNNLILDIRANDDAVTCGAFGFRHLLVALAREYKSDVIYEMLVQTNAPGYAQQLLRGATTLPEAWDASPECGQNSMQLGGVEEWFYEWLAGIETMLDKPGFRGTDFHPAPVGSLTHVKASHESPRGTVASEWTRQGRKFRLTITVPGNSMGRVHLPQTNPNAILEGGKPAAQAQSVKFLRKDENGSVFEVGSGVYTFECEL